jgi:putative transposase
MIRTFRYPLRPTKAQERVLNWWLAKCCELYNAALEQRREAWRKQRRTLSYYDQQNELTELRRSDREWWAMPAWVQRSALTRLDRAYKAYFFRIRSEESAGLPRFRSSSRYRSFSLPNAAGGSVIDGNTVVLPKLGAVRFHKYRELRGAPKEVRVHHGARGWSVSIVCDLGESPAKQLVRNVIGIDVGLEAFATLSSGERVENPRYGRDGAELLARTQRELARKNRGSNNHKLAKIRAARAHEAIRNRRLDFARKLAVVLFARFDLVAHEDLQIARMVRGNLAKSIYDAAWGQFLRCLALKAENAGKHCIAVDPRGTSQICSACGAVEKKELSQRQHRCDCGFTAHRDHNAALNVLARGLRVGQLTEASKEAEPLPLLPQKERQ